jgi:hypothetical protein
MKASVLLLSVAFISLASVGAGPASAGGERASAGPDIITGSDFDAIVAAMEENGFQVELTTDKSGDPLIRSTDKQEPFSIQFYKCTDGKDCQFMQFISGWDLPNGVQLQTLQDWNSKKVWGQAYRDDKKDPWLALPVNLKGGVTAENLSDMIDWWKTLLKQYAEFIGWTKS